MYNSIVVEIVINNKRVSTIGWIKEVVQFRELLYFFVWRDLKVRYKQTVLGVLWVVLQPIITVAIFSYIFGSLEFAKATTVPYPVLAFVGMFFWLLFSNIINSVSNSITSNQHIIQKVYFPNILVPLSATIVSIFDSLVMLIVLIGFFAVYGVTYSFAFLLFLFLGLVITAIFGFGAGLFLGALNVKYRDVRYVLPFVIQVLFFLSPVIYTATLLSKKLVSFLQFNPLFGIINSVRSSLVDFYSIPWLSFGLSVVITSMVLVVGLITFKRLEREFADLI